MQRFQLFQRCPISLQHDIYSYLFFFKFSFLVVLILCTTRPQTWSKISQKHVYSEIQLSKSVLVDYVPVVCSFITFVASM